MVHNGHTFAGAPIEDSRTPILMLHGFPEFWIAWEGVMQALGDEFLILAPDQRGYNQSDAPAGVEQYRAKALVADMITLTNAFLGERPFVLAGHDWGASIAYAMAINFPQKIKSLIIANGVHPVCFQKALIDSPAQADASSYFHLLRSEKAAAVMAEDNFRRTFAMFEKFSETPWLTPALKSRYRSAWANQERLQAMLHWYNSSPIVVPQRGEEVKDAPLYNVAEDNFRISMPHTLIWGEKDQALLPDCHAILPRYCDALRKSLFQDADHWILHTHAAPVSDLIRVAAREADC